MKKQFKLKIRESLLVATLMSPLFTPTQLFSQVQMSQVKTINKIVGVVLNENKKPVLGVSVFVKGDEKTATITNSKGEFIISPNKENATLVFKSVGYKTQEILVKPDTKLPLGIILVATDEEIDEVVVTGYANRTKESFTGSASTFTKQELLRVGNKNVLQSLQNLDPSFVLTENLSIGSNPNALPDIQLRGQAGLGDIRGDYAGNPNEPLFILDGFEANLQKIYDLDMNRVSSITLLKDASAKAIYGAKAANGVVIIETTTPAEGKMRVSYTGNFNIEAPDLTSYHLANASEKLQIEKNAGRYTSTQPFIQEFLNEQYNEIYKNIARGVDTYWLSQPLRTGFGDKHTVMLEGGTSALRYALDLTYNNVTGVMKGSNRENVGGSINLAYRNGKLNFRNILNINFNKSNNSPYGNFSSYTSLNPYYSPYDEYGNITKLLGTFRSSTSSSATPLYYFNPLYDATLQTKDFSKYHELTENFYAEYQANQNLKLTARIGYTFNGNNYERFLPGDHTSFANWTGENFYKRGSYNITDGESHTLSSDVFANWSKKFDKHLIFVNGGANIAAFTNQTHGMTAWGFLNNRVDYITFAKQYEDNGVPSGGESIKREVGLIGFANYSYDNRYLLDLSIRSNASSVFGADNRWGTFWSAGLGWNAHHETFLKNIQQINQFKIRGSVGSTGNQNFNPYQAMTTYNFFNSSTYDNISGAYLYAMANDKLKWQETIDYNVGADMKFFNKLNLRFDYYVSNTNNLLIDFTLPPSTGFYSFKENLGKTQNKGLEGSISYLAYSNPEKQSYFSVFTSFAKNSNKLLQIADALKQINSERDNATDNLNVPKLRYEEGQSINSIWAVPSLGIDPTTGREVFLSKSGESTYTWNPDDQVVVGVSDPKLRGNIGFNMEYKGWGLSTSLRYTFDADYYNSTLVNRVENVNVAYNVDTRVLYNTWLNVGDQSYYKKITSTPTTTRPTSRFLQNKSDLTLSSINAYYDFKWKNLAKYKLQNLKLGLYMSEVFTLSNIKTERGTEYPFARSFSFTLQTTF